MKKGLFLFAVLSTAILSVISVIQFNGDSCDDLLNANVEALARSDSGSGDGTVHCTVEPGICEYDVILYDPEGNVLKNAEGEIISIHRKDSGLKNLPPKQE